MRKKFLSQDLVKSAHTIALNLWFIVKFQPAIRSMINLNPKKKWVQSDLIEFRSITKLILSQMRGGDKYR